MEGNDPVMAERIRRELTVLERDEANAGRSVGVQRRDDAPDIEEVGAPEVESADGVPAPKTRGRRK